MDVRRALEEAAVGIRDTGVEAVLGPRAARIVQGLEQAAEIVGARAPTVRQEIVDDPREAVGRDLPEVLGEHRPDALEEEVAQHVGRRGTALAEMVVDVGHVLDRLASQLRLPAGEHGLVAGEEEQGRVLLGQLT